MRHFLLLCVVMLSLGISSFAQDSRGISFQGIARDESGSIFANQSIILTIYLETGSSSSTAIYKETQTIKTDNYGVFNAVLGTGSPVTGSGLASQFSAVDFSKQYNVQVDVTIGTNTNTLINYSLQAVPYAKFANNANNANNGVPPGTIMAFAGTNIPAGWVKCDASIYDGTDPKYAALYAAIGINWGGTGATSFRVPDLRGAFLRGVDDGAGMDPDAKFRGARYGSNTGDKVGTAEANQNASHIHAIYDPGHIHNMPLYLSASENAGYGMAASPAFAGRVAINAPSMAAGFSSSSVSTGISIINSGGNESRPYNLSVYYIIKL